MVLEQRHTDPSKANADCEKRAVVIRFLALVTGGALNPFPTPPKESSIFRAQFESGGELCSSVFLKAASHLFMWTLRLGGLITEHERKTVVELLCVRLPQLSVSSFPTKSVCSALADISFGRPCRSHIVSAECSLSRKNEVLLEAQRYHFS